MSLHRDSYRGFDRGRGRWSGRGGASFSRVEQPHMLQPPKPLGPTIDSINIKALLTEEQAPKIEDVEYVASYNWLNGKSPVILVPGSPPAWTPPAIDRKMKPDSEEVFRDINAAHYAAYPMEPTFRALQAMQPSYEFGTLDIVGCGSTLGNLVRFAGSQSRPFRFDVDVIGSTLLFVRREKSPTEVIADVRGYGHTFPEAYTTWDHEVRNSCSHQRIIQYEFGGLKLLVRTETDGYVKSTGGKALATTAVSTSSSSLDDALSQMAVSFTGIPQDQKLQLKMQGTRVSQDQIFDIKTRAIYTKPFNLAEILPRLWMNQTSKFLVAYHESGLFDKPEVHDVRKEVLRWEKSNSALLERFHAVLKRIVDVVLDSDKQQCEVSWDGEGPLRVTRQIGEGRRALPPDLVNRFEDL